MSREAILSVVLPRLSIAIAIAFPIVLKEVTLEQWLSYTLLSLAGLIIIMLAIGSLFNRYCISYKISRGTINFDFPYWKRIIRLGHIPKLGQVKALVKYKYSDSKYWTFEAPAIWEDTGTALISVNGCSERKLQLYQYKGDKIVPLGNVANEPLSGEVTIRIKLIQLRGNRLLATFDISLVFEEGYLTERGFIVS